MEKFIAFIIVVMFGVMITGNVASAHEVLYNNTYINRSELEKDDCSAKLVVWDYDGFRTEFEGKKSESEETLYEKGFNFGYEISSYISLVDGFSLEKRNDHVMFLSYEVDGHTCFIIRASAAEMLNEMVKTFMDAGY